MLPYASIVEADLGAGIDQRSAENALQPGYCERLINVDPLAEGSLRKRRGYQAHYGQLPVRVQSIQYTDDPDDNVILTLDTSISLATIRSTPIVVYGRTTDAQVGDFTNVNGAAYYPKFKITQPIIVPTGAHTETIEGNVHAFGTPFLEVVTARALALNSTNNEEIETDGIRINQISNDVEVDFVNGTGSSFNAYVALARRSPASGVTFVSAPTAVASGAHTASIPASTHQLNNFNIMATLYQDDGTDLIQIAPDEVRIDALGEVEIDFVNGTGSSIDVVIILHSVPQSQVRAYALNPNETTTKVLTDVTHPYNVVRIYSEDPVGAPGLWNEVKADSIRYDEGTEELRVQFVNGSPDSANFYILFDEAQLLVNSLQVSGSVIGTGDQYVDLEPQISIYGLDHQLMYGVSPPERAGWVHHIDLYRSDVERALIAGLGGVLHRETPTAPTLQMANQRYVDLRARISGTQHLRPAFASSIPAIDRTRGTLAASNVDARGRVPIISSQWNPIEGVMEIECLFEDYAASQSLANIIGSAVVDGKLADWITVEGAPRKRLNGQWRIREVLDLVEGDDLRLTFLVEVDSIQSSSYNGTGGFLAIYTDRIEFINSPSFLPGDRLLAETFPEGRSILTLKVDAAEVVVSGIDSHLVAASGVRVVGSRLGKCVPLRDGNDLPNVTGIVKGDSLAVLGQVRRHRVLGINTASNVSVSITGDGEVATLTAPGDELDTLEEGNRFLILGSEYYDGEWEIEQILAPTIMTFKHPSTESDSGTLVGKCITIDEERILEDPLNNETPWRVDGRFIPIDAPSSTQDLPAKTVKEPLSFESFSNQPIVRSTLINDSLFLTNGSDDLLKYDGLHLYRAGLFRWQPRLFATPDTGPTAAINLGNPSVVLRTDGVGTPSSELSIFHAADGADVVTYIVGDRIVDNRDGATYFIRDVDEFTATIRVDRTISATGNGSVTRATELSYYARVQLIDRNGYVVAGASSGTDDTRVIIGADTAVRLRFLAPPVIGQYDYDRMEIEVYRREDDTAFRRIRTLSVPYSEDQHYIDLLDTDAPDVLVDLDPTVGVLDPDGLGQTWSEPIRSKYVTSAAGRLLLGNVRSYPEIRLSWERRSLDVVDADFIASGNSILTLRREEALTGTTTDMLNVVRYEFLPTSGASAIVGITVGGGNDSFSVEVAGHGLSVGDWVYLFHSTEANTHSLQFSGWYQVGAITDVDNFVINAQVPTGYTPSGADVDRCLIATDAEDVPVPIGTDGNYFTRRGQSGTLRALPLRVGIQRLGDAINASMRCVDRTLSGQGDFEAWATASAGGEFEAGQLIIKQPYSTTAARIGCELDDYTDAFRIFANGSLRLPQALIGAIVEEFPSRVLLSYSNFAEIFDAPLADPTQSVSAIDVNPADGQEITGMIPFFGESAFGSAQKSGVVVIFKSSSIYLLDVNTRQVQKVDSQGLGCTAPYSIAYTKDAVMFANSAGIYRLTQDLRVEFIGRFLTRIWQNEVDRERMAIMTGHHYAEGKQYKLSVPTSTSRGNELTFVYDHTREFVSGTIGAWTEYDNHPSIGWVNREEDAFFASTRGTVYKVREEDNERPFRDDDVAIMAAATLRAMDFGAGGTRKAYGPVTAHFRTDRSSTDGTTLASAVDLTDTYRDADPVHLDRDKKIQSIQFSLSERRGTHLQLRFTNAKLDEGMEISNVDFRVAGLGDGGITQAKDTTNKSGS